MQQFDNWATNQAEIWRGMKKSVILRGYQKASNLYSFKLSLKILCPWYVIRLSPTTQEGARGAA